MLFGFVITVLGHMAAQCYNVCGTHISDDYNCCTNKEVPILIETNKKTQNVDADDNILYIFAHAQKIRNVVNMSI